MQENQDKKINNASFLIKDLLYGDSSVEKRQDYEDLTGQDIIDAYKIIVDNPKLSEDMKKYFMTNSWRIHYHTKPPNPDEFLTEEWIGPTAISVYDHIKKAFSEFFHPLSKYRHLILACAIGYGKSFLSTVTALYTMCCLWCMKDNKKFFGLSEAYPIVTALVSFSMDKAKQVLFKPFMNILTSSKKFVRIRTEEKLKERQKEEPDKIIWTTAGAVGSIQFSCDSHIITASNPRHIIGLTLISAVLSELSFFIDRGVSPEFIWQIYNDAKQRVYSRFGIRYYSTTIMDSSPNDIELSPIDKYIFEGEAEKDPLNYIITGPQWEYLPEKYPIWRKSGETFPLFRGGSGKPPSILTKNDIKKYNKQEIYNVPIDIKQFFIDNITKATKDYCGWPSGSQGKLITDFKYIEKMFYPNLENIYSYITAPADKKPERLIWDQIKDKFFINLGAEKYLFYRAPYEYRYLHADQSESGDVTGLTMVHPEVDINGNIISVVDFTIAIIPTDVKINLDSIASFIYDLWYIGKIKFAVITFDQYQSSGNIQRLKRDLPKEVNIGRLSVDKDVNQYRLILSYLYNYRIKSGRNIILKNNLKSLQEIRTDKNKLKIDHMKGKTVLKDDGNWKTSLMGINAKDVSDSWCGANWNCIQNFKGIPKYTWKENEEKIELNKITEDDKQILLNNILNKHGMQQAYNN